mmetsp:Transcript_11437/g.12282  ORF Transcript_11437/g.12282 Transcript_11437/m.12282 type:complete len:242 (+) Transcript_11437:708-1433(+)
MTLLRSSLLFCLGLEVERDRDFFSFLSIVVDWLVVLSAWVASSSVSTMTFSGRPHSLDVACNILLCRVLFSLMDSALLLVTLGLFLRNPKCAAIGPVAEVHTVFLWKILLSNGTAAQACMRWRNVFPCTNAVLASETVLALEYSLSDSSGRIGDNSEISSKAECTSSGSPGLLLVVRCFCFGDALVATGEDLGKFPSDPPGKSKTVSFSSSSFCWQEAVTAAAAALSALTFFTRNDFHSEC